MRLFKKPKSKFYWYDFTVRGHRYRASTQETKSVKAVKIASLKLASVIENTDPLPSTPTVLGDFAVKIGGIEQWMTIRGEDRNNPVLLHKDKVLLVGHKTHLNGTYGFE